MVKISFIGHSAFKITGETYSLLIDPFITGNPVAAYSDLKADDILLTHAHGDHLGDSIEIAKNTGAQITAIFELANYCTEKGVKAQGVNIGGKVPFPWGSAYWLPAAHSSGTPDGRYGGVPASILINIDGKSIYHAGDTGLHYDMKMIGEFYKPQIAMLPIGGFYTMGINEAVRAAQWLDCNKIIPMHYDTFPPIKTDPEEFKAELEAIGKECIILKPGQKVEI